MKIKFSIFFTIIAFLSLCFFVKPAFADSSNAVKSIVLQVSPDFLGKDNPPTRVDTMNVTIYAFTTNGGEAQTKPSPGDIELTLTLTKSTGQSIVIDQKLLIKDGTISGEIPVQFPSEGKWTISATGTLDGIPLNSINISTNIEIVYVGTPSQLSLSPFIANISTNRTQQYTAQWIYSDGSSYDASNEVVWTARPSYVASIDSKGLATGLSIGIATINAYDPVYKFSENALLIVTPDILNTVLTILPPNAKIGVGGTQQFQATMTTSITLPVVGTISSSIDVTSLVSWTSTKPDVASMSNPSGLANGLSPGVTQIVATLPLVGSATSTLEVEELKLIPQSSTISIGDQLQFILKLVNPDLSELDVTNSAQWTTLNSSIASIDNSNMKGLATGVSAGTTTITATYSGMSASANLTVLKAQTVDHFGFVNSSGSSISYPHLNLRSDVNVSDSNWAYIGEPMQIDVYLKAYTKDGVPDSNYIWDTDWFNDSNNWHITPSASSIDDPSLLSISVSDSILHALIEIKLNDSNKRQTIQNFSVTLKPTDSSGISTPMATPAAVSNQVTTFTLYGGRIRVAQNSYFYQEIGMVPVYVEKFDGEFVQNTDDGQTYVSEWELRNSDSSVTIVSTPEFEFSGGSGQVQVRSDTSNVEKILTPKKYCYPSYFETVSGTLKWGQIVNTPPPEPNEGTVWEWELLP